MILWNDDPICVYFQDEEHDLTTNQVGVCNLALLYEVALLKVHLGAPF